MGEGEPSPGEGAGGVDAVVSYLRDAGVSHEVLEHEPTYSASEDAKATGTTLAEEAKTILLRSGDQYRVAVLPASGRLDLHKLRELLGETSRLRLATEEEMRADFPQFEVGAVPPFGAILSAPEVIDRRLIDCERIVCAAGDHRHSLRIDPREITRVGDALVADICED
jgi:Ala-tRNA(Pro) deacylase